MARPEYVEWLSDAANVKYQIIKTRNERLCAENEQLRAALAEAIGWSYGDVVTPERRDELERIIDT